MCAGVPAQRVRGAARRRSALRARHGHRAGRPLGQRQEQPGQPAAALLRAQRRRASCWTARTTERLHAGLAAPADRAGSGRAWCCSTTPWPTTSPTASWPAPARRTSSPRPRRPMRWSSSQRCRTASIADRRGRQHAVRRPAPAHRDCARDPQERADPGAGRSDQRAGHRIRAADPAGAAAPDAAIAPRWSSRIACPRSKAPTRSR